MNEQILQYFVTERDVAALKQAVPPDISSRDFPYALGGLPRNPSIGILLSTNRQFIYAGAGSFERNCGIWNFWVKDFSKETLSFLEGLKNPVVLLHEIQVPRTLYETATEALRCHQALPSRFGCVLVELLPDQRRYYRFFRSCSDLENYCAMLEVEKEDTLRELRGAYAYVPVNFGIRKGYLWRLNLDTGSAFRAYVPLLLARHPRIIPVFKKAGAPFKVLHFYQLRAKYPPLGEMVQKIGSSEWDACSSYAIAKNKLELALEQTQWYYAAYAILSDFNEKYAWQIKWMSYESQEIKPDLLLLDLNLSYADDSPIVKRIRQWLEAGINVVVCQPSRSSFPLHADFTSSVSSYAVSPFGGMCKVHSQSGGSVTPLPRTLLLSLDTRRATIPAEEKVLASILRDLIQEGKSDREICQLRSLTASTLRHLKQKYYLRSRFSASKKRTGLKKKIEKMALQVSTAEEIAKTLNTTPEHVKRTIAKMKFKQATVNDFIKK